MSDIKRKPVLVHGWMSVADMLEACGMRLVRTPGSDWTFKVRSQIGEPLFAGSLREIRHWLRTEGYVR